MLSAAVGDITATNPRLLLLRFDCLERRLLFCWGVTGLPATLAAAEGNLSAMAAALIAAATDVSQKGSCSVIAACCNAEDWDILAGDCSVFGALSARYLRDLEAGDVSAMSRAGSVAKDCGQGTLASDKHSFFSDELAGMAARDVAFKVRRTNPGPGSGLSVAELATLAAFEPCSTVMAMHRNRTAHYRAYYHEEHWRMDDRIRR